MYTGCKIESDDYIRKISQGFLTGFQFIGVLKFYYNRYKIPTMKKNKSNLDMKKRRTRRFIIVVRIFKCDEEKHQYMYIFSSVRISRKIRLFVLILLEKHQKYEKPK